MQTLPCKHSPLFSQLQHSTFLILQVNYNVVVTYTIIEVQKIIYPIVNFLFLKKNIYVMHILTLAKLSLKNRHGQCEISKFSVFQRCVSDATECN